MKILFLVVGALALFWAVTLWKAARNEAQAEAEYPPLGEIIDVEGTPVHYLQRGDGPDVVLIHGASGNLRDFSDLVVRLVATGHRVTAFDRPGLGHTGQIDPDGASIFEQAELLVAASARIGVDAPIVVGHSYGGAVALAWATRHAGAAAGVVLLAGASHPWDGGISLYYRILSHPLGQALVVPVLTAWVPERVVTDTIASIFTPQAVPEGYAEHIGAGLTLRRVSMRENALQRATILDEVTAMVPTYPDLTMPVEVLHGTEDGIVGLSVHAERLAVEAPGADLVVMEGVGHSPHHAEPETVIAAIDRAVRRAGLR